MRLLIAIVGLVIASVLAERCSEKEDFNVLKCYQTFFKAYNWSNPPEDTDAFSKQMNLHDDLDWDCDQAEKTRKCLEGHEKCAEPMHMKDTLEIDLMAANVFHSYLASMEVLCESRQLVRKSKCNSMKEFENAFRVCKRGIDKNPRIKLRCPSMRAAGQCVYQQLNNVGCETEVADLWCRVGTTRLVSVVPVCLPMTPACRDEDLKS